ncbi:CAP domain-containing protein [Alkalihalobacillus oceani]|uniref:CAP domain-containing protein n=1 Tax=Halalkalibacter oceani TaxID=1653776 RepID=A0A9X2IRZ5_9BACI|nr:CAP domain-containing protein [Halalkalibacter oceani]MCM3716048.1 CAP domain-containing protein [Halalkalibacter oceani]
MKKIRSYLAAAFISGVLSLAPITASATPIDVIDPFEDLDQKDLQQTQQELLEWINVRREMMGLPAYTLHEDLNKSAQSHANYQTALNQSTGHFQPEKDHPLYTGERLENRTAYFGYDAITGGEGITGHTVTPVVALQALLDAPYHRMDLLNPNHRHIGFGVTNVPYRRSALVNNYGGPERYTAKELVSYPFDGQINVPISWYNSEIPNPLERFGLSGNYVGYPISLEAYGYDQLKYDEVILEDEWGQEIDSYLVGGTKENPFVRHLHIIPKEVLKPGTTYHVSVRGTVVDHDGASETFDKNWSFTTVESLAIQGLSIRGVNQLVWHFYAGSLDEVSVELFNGTQLFHVYHQKDRKISGYYVRPLITGTYTVRVSSPYYDEPYVGEIEIKGNLLQGYEITGGHHDLPLTAGEKLVPPPEEEPVEEEPVEEDVPNVPVDPVVPPEVEDPPANNEDDSAHEEEVVEEPTEEQPQDEQDQQETPEEEQKETPEPEKPSKTIPSSSDYHTVKIEKSIRANDVLRINFTGEIDASSITKDSVFLIDQNGNEHPVDSWTERRDITLAFQSSSKDGYPPGSYTLVVDREKVKGQNGLNIARGLLVTFTVR